MPSASKLITADVAYGAYEPKLLLAPLLQLVWFPQVVAVSLQHGPGCAWWPSYNAERLRFSNMLAKGRSLRPADQPAEVLVDGCPGSETEV